MHDHQTIEIKACKPYRSEDVVNYCITAIVYNTGRKAELLNEFAVWAPAIIKKCHSFKVCFTAVPQCMLVALLTRCKFMRESQLSGVVRIIHFDHNDDVMVLVKVVLVSLNHRAQ